MFLKVAKCQRVIPGLLVQIEQHLLFQVVSAVSNRNRVVVTIEAVDQSLNRWLLQVTDVRSGLPRLLVQGNRLRIDGAEGIDDDLGQVKNKVYAQHIEIYLSLDRLNWINHNGDCTIRQRLKALLCIDIDSRQPATKSRMAVVPKQT